ncbi:MAG: GNAT family N-acetyltransferase [Phycisphaerae bacterium]|jgi:predicted N-acetyltransferase YhbS
MELTTLTRNDLPELLDLCSAALPLDTFSLGLLERTLFADPRCDPRLMLGARRDGRLVGVAVGVNRLTLDGQRRGWIKLWAVAAEARGEGLGRRLLRELESRLREAAPVSIDTAGAPYYFWPGPDVRYTPACCLLEAEGYAYDRCNVNMAVDLASRSFITTADEERLATQGFAFHRADGASLPMVLDFIRQEWPVWADETYIAMSSVPPAVFYATHEGRVIAFAAYDAAMFPGTFGPTGTDPAMRGRGVGTVLLKKCLQDMKERGYPRCEIAWVGPVAFYARQIGAVINRVFREYRKELKADGSEARTARPAAPLGR